MSGLFNSALWGRGFRPFFLLGAFYAVLMVAAWVFIFQGDSGAPMMEKNPVLWHAHEMIYGFTLAIITGFLLTAVANWTGGAPVRQLHLAFLCLLWIAGRAAFWYPYASPVVLAAIDLSFIPFLAASLAVPLFRSWNSRNFVFLGLLSLLFLCNLYIHLTENGFVAGDPRQGAYAAVLVVVMVISVVASRIIPSFTVASLRMQGKIRYQTDQRKTDIAALLFLVALTLSIAYGGLNSPVAGFFALCAAGLHFWRMRFWHTLESRSDPLLWILHAGHFWLAAGLLALGLHGCGVIVQPSLGLHMLTVGCIGSMTLGMMARVALGHTGRSLEATSVTVLAFWLMQAAAVLRVETFIAESADYGFWVAVSGALWAGAFALYLLVYTPVLLAPRPDGLAA